MKRRQIIILILLLVVGFASVTTTLVLNGNIGVGVELDDFDVIFIEALLDGKESDKATISEDKKTITFSTDKLTNLGDSARLDYKVKNTSTQYDADVTINCTNDASEYITVTSSFYGNSLPLENLVNIKAQEVKNGYVDVELIKAYPGEDKSLVISCKIVFTASSRETYAYSLNFNSNGGSKIDDKSVILNDNYGELDIPTREGYTFLGWYDEDDNKVDENTILDSKGNRNLYAKWDVNIYPVNIVTNENGTSESSSIDVPYGKTANIKMTPDKNYYISSIECTDGYTVENYDSKVPKYGEQSITIKNNQVEKSGTCTFTFKQGIYEYGYTGSEQSFSVPLNGDYKIELWGAQGGTYDSTYYGGYGAYSVGNISLDKDLILYVNVGGTGSIRRNNNDSVTLSGGYNGGGNALYSWTSTTNPSNQLFNISGGGATHISLKSGLLETLVNDVEKIMIIASGGGGAQYFYHTGSYSYFVGGHGGGISGGLNKCIQNGLLSDLTIYNTATQVSGAKTYYSGYSYGAFGKGAAGYSGGGGGYYGGAGHYCVSGGGSSYIGNPLLTNKSMYCYNCTESNEESTKTISTTCTSSSPTSNCAKQGNGYAKITLISID